MSSIPLSVTKLTTTQSQIANQFSHQAHRYDEYATVQKLIAQDLLARLESLSGTLLDIGCGTGRVTQSLRDFSEHVIGVDVSMGMLQHALKTQTAQEQLTHLSTLNWVCGDVQTLPFQSASVDVVFSSMVLQWCMPINQALTEIIRVLNVGGRAWLTMMIDGSFAELDRCWSNICGKSKVNTFANVESLNKLCSDELNGRVSLEFKTYQTWHPNLSSLLKSITRVGAGVSLSGANNGKLTKTQFKQIEQCYFSTFANEQGLPLTYEVAFIQVEK